MLLNNDVHGKDRAEGYAHGVRGGDGGAHDGRGVCLLSQLHQVDMADDGDLACRPLELAAAEPSVQVAEHSKQVEAALALAVAASSLAESQLIEVAAVAWLDSIRVAAASVVACLAAWSSAAVAMVMEHTDIASAVGLVAAFFVFLI